MQWIKKKILRFHIKRLVKSSKKVRWNVGYQQAQTIGILYTREAVQKEAYIVQFIDMLAKTGKVIQVLEYIPEILAQQETIHKKQFPSFVAQEVPYLGKSENEELNKFIATSFDYLYHIDLASHTILDYLLAKSQAKCRIGSFTSSRINFFEVMIKVKTQLDDTLAYKSLTKYMLYYTQLL